MHLCSMNLSIEVVYLLITITALVILASVAYKISSKKNTKENSVKPYEISQKKHQEFQKIDSSVIINTTITFTNTDTTSALEGDRGYAGYESIVFKGVSLLKKDGFKIPVLGRCDNEQ